jgi:methyl coenzyme M reductase beta subunit
MVRKVLISVFAAAAAFAANPACASVYSYTMNNGSVMTINNTAATGTWIGTDINVSFSGSSLTAFAGGFDLPSFMGNILIASTSTRTSNGVTYAPNTNHQQMLETGTAAGGKNKVNLWSYWGPLAAPSSQNLLGDYVMTAVSSSTGGTAVPEPGMVGLFGLGVAGLLFGRRRAQRHAPAVNLAVA